MAWYQRKPLPVEAFQMTKAHWHNITEWPEWVRKAWLLQDGAAGGFYLPGSRDGSGFCIQTIEGPKKALWGDWIIKGVQGNLYPCTPELFKATYEPVEAMS